ncbi:hypothetical protein AB0L00_44090 [Actinoallomurus sp. NPDC052308]|uniref:hypothetical protein n=1 Tax=Actinoallomurus sp. NPDC052308 TaxID=3155530 RepID=UPI00343D9571
MRRLVRAGSRSAYRPGSARTCWAIRRPARRGGLAATSVSLRHRVGGGAYEQGDVAQDLHDLPLR